tara:strand:- start:184 stop:435 length:252 start_codon:yes stop_codon:yes gene_type:complete
MSKRNYKLTLCNYGYKVEVWDNYGKYVCVYEKTRESASEFILNWWEKSDENKRNDELMSRAILNCIKLDEKRGVLTNNRDNLD